jgi:hypothetical protein
VYNAQQNDPSESESEVSFSCYSPRDSAHSQCFQVNFQSNFSFTSVSSPPNFHFSSTKVASLQRFSELFLFLSPLLRANGPSRDFSEGLPCVIRSRSERMNVLEAESELLLKGSGGLNEAHVHSRLDVSPLKPRANSITLCGTARKFASKGQPWYHRNEGFWTSQRRGGTRPRIYG